MLALYLPLQTAEETLHGGDHTRVARRFIPLRQRLEQHVHGPGIVLVAIGCIMERTQPAILLLMLQDIVHPVPHLALQRFAIQQEGQRDQSIEPVRGALPALSTAPCPGALGDIGPELVQVPAQTLGLDTQLLQQPACRSNAPQRKRLEGVPEQLLLCIHSVCPPFLVPLADKQQATATNHALT